MNTPTAPAPILDEHSMRRMEAALFARIDAAEANTPGRTESHNSVAGREISSPRSRRRWIGVSSVAAAALAVALVLTDVVGFAGWRGGSETAAAAVLEQAATSAVQLSDPVVGDGEYLLVETKAVNINSTDGTSFLALTTDQMYIPEDRDDDWVWFRPVSQPYGSFGPESQAASEANFAAIYAEHGEDYVEKLRAPAGRWYSGDSQVSPEALSDLPRDPHRLLNYIYRTTLGSGPSQDGEALVFIADRLRSGVLPADVRASLYQAAALIPGVEFVEDQATLDGRTGTAIGRVETNGNFRQDIIVDPDTGLFIGERRTELTAQDGIPANTITSWTSVTTTVVPNAPAGGTQNGFMDDMGCVTTNGGSICPP
ncbi:CU044_5270 family protein [Arthrobacter sp. Soc17.1.1.1]|uniref:CU044_5270 family protein n=1 Tax=Arthrobacter sp. Soc17.1.1.1 TaxID=3121277 RepID=UPI002FE4EA4F